MASSGRSDETGLDRLSAREEQILGLAADGLLDKQIARTLGLSENTLRTYWRRVRNKLGDAPRSALAALYAKSQANDESQETGVWTIDLRTHMVDYHADRGLLPQGETTLEEALMAIYPEDRERLRELIDQMAERDVPPITVMIRVLTAKDVEAVCYQMEPAYDAEGTLVRIVGRPVPILDLTRDPKGASRFGYYRRDLDTGEVEVDEGLRAIFRIAPDEQDLHAAVLRSFCPSARQRMQSLVDGMIATGSRQRWWTACLCFPDGERVWVSSQSRLEERDGHPSAFVATAVAFL